MKEYFAQVEEFKHRTAWGKFDWERQWYPMAFVVDLDPSRPHAIQLLGKDLVLWRDGAGEWRCFEDRCPHRLAPLSGGNPCLSWEALFLSHLPLLPRLS